MRFSERHTERINQSVTPCVREILSVRETRDTLVERVSRKPECDFKIIKFIKVNRMREDQKTRRPKSISERQKNKAQQANDGSLVY